MSGARPGRRVPMNDLKRIYESHAKELRAAVTEVMASGWWINGQRLATFAASFAGYVGAHNCIGAANGSDALEIAFRALKDTRCQGRFEVVTVANAGGYCTTACRQAGLVPVYADIEEGSQLASIDSILAALSDQSAFVVVTHLYGGVFDVPDLRRRMNAAGYRHVPILEDCSQAHGATLGDRKAGSLGDIAVFSFYPTKNLGAMGDAGAILTSDEELATACRLLSQYGWSEKYRIARNGGRNSRMDEMQAAILSVLLTHLEEANARRVGILNRYGRSTPPGLKLVRSAKGTVGHLAVFLCENRQALRAHMEASGVATDIHYPVLDCDQPGWQGLPQRLAPGGLDVSRSSAERLVTLPLFPSMTAEEVDQVCKALSAWQA
jgi:aminotransferase EvaB